MFRTSDLEKFDPVRFSEIARVLLVRPIVPMFVYTKAAASDAVAFGIIDRLGRWVMSQGRFAQVVIGIRDIRKIGPFGSEKIEADGIDRYAVKGHKTHRKSTRLNSSHSTISYAVSRLKKKKQT